MTFACPNCGRPNGSPDGRTHAVRCACGQTLVLASPAPGGSPPGQSRPPPLPARAARPSAPAYDPVAAHHGLLISEAQTRALAAPIPFLVQADDADVPTAGDAPSSPGPPGPAGRDEPRRRGAPRAPTIRRSRSARHAVAILAVLVAAAAAWFLVPRASIRLPPAVAGALDRIRGRPAGAPGDAEVAAALEASARPLRACVRAAERGPQRLRLAGRRVILHVTVTPSGRVTAPRLDEAGLDRSPPGACLKSAARRMAFPPHDGGPVDVRIPLELAGHG